MQTLKTILNKCSSRTSEKIKIWDRCKICDTVEEAGAEWEEDNPKYQLRYFGSQ